MSKINRVGLTAAVAMLFSLHVQSEQRIVSADGALACAEGGHTDDDTAVRHDPDVDRYIHLHRSVSSALDLRVGHSFGAPACCSGAARTLN